MADTKQTLTLKEPYNPMDPIVEFDPEFKASNVVMSYDNDSKEDADSDAPNAAAKTKLDGIRFPIIKLNNLVMTPERIKHLKVKLIDFLPTIELDVFDTDGSIQATDVPGLNNVITFILIAPVDGANKKISMDFYITSCTFENGIGIYKGEYKLIALQQEQCKQIGTESISTYDMLYQIAKDCALGFSASAGCKDISDKKWRQIYSETYKDYIPKQLEFGGLDENSVFQAWIDSFGYLVMVNVAKALLDEIDPLQLTIKVIEGESGTDKNDLENDVREVQRIIHNAKAGGIHNLRFETQKPIVNTDNTKNHGTLRTVYYMSGAGNDNTISTKQVQIIEDSVDGKEGIADYTYEKKEFLGVDMSDDSNQLYQREVVKANQLKYFSEQLMVEMIKPNYTLQRGTLISVVNFEYNAKNKSVLLNNAGNARSLEPSVESTKQELTDKNSNKEFIEDDSTPIPNDSLSGIYYINGIEYEWNKKDIEITQRLFLVKKGIRNKVYNKLIIPKNV